MQLIYVFGIELLQIYSEIIMAQKGSEEKAQPVVEKMPLLLATIYESARVMPAGPLLQRCSLKHGKQFFELLNENYIKYRHGTCNRYI